LLLISDEKKEQILSLKIQQSKVSTRDRLRDFGWKGRKGLWKVLRDTREAKKIDKIKVRRMEKRKKGCWVEVTIKRR